MTRTMSSARIPKHVRQYKELLRRVLDSRPSGTRQRLAVALGTNRSFVSQISSPTYKVAIPAHHIETIFEVCHFSPAERAEFLAAYGRAHPGKAAGAGDVRRMRHISLTVPDLGDDKQNAALDRAIGEFISKITSIAGKGGG